MLIAYRCLVDNTDCYIVFFSIMFVFTIACDLWIEWHSHMRLKIPREDYQAKYQAKIKITCILKSVWRI